MRKLRRYGQGASTITLLKELTMKLTTTSIRGLTTVALHLPALRPRAARLPLYELRKQTTISPKATPRTPEALRVICLLPLLLLLASPTLAQNSIVFTAEATSGVETVTPVLTWNTIPLADDCIASGDWSGSKGPTGTETLPAITSGATYNLTCSWLDDAATLSWTAPTQNTDGTPLTDLDGFKIKWGQTQGGPYTSEVDIADETATSAVVQPLASGNWFFVATAYNAIGVESDVSNEAMKVLGLVTIIDSIGITVNPKPNAPSGLGVE